MADEFQVKGQNIITNDSFKINPKAQSRKIFNTKWFEKKNYEHEIANHYRDYKQLKISRTRRAGFRAKKVFFEEKICDSRDVLSMKRIDFPQSILPKPQRKNCKLPLLKNIYNHTLQRVVAADSVCELKLLTKRHSRFNGRKSNIKIAKRTLFASSSSKSEEHRTVISGKKGKHYNLGHIEPEGVDKILFKDTFVYIKSTVTKDCKQSEKGLSVVELSGEEINDDKNNYFLQLASECYNEGFLTHIKYLESIGDRNAINNQISRRKPQHSSKSKNTTTSRPQSSGSNASSNNSAEDSANNTGVRKFILVVKRVLQNRFFIQNPCNYDERIHGLINHDWKIRVNITRSSSPESLSRFLEFQDNIKSNHNIMSEILNVNENQSQGISPSNASSVKHQHFHNLIENLSNLEISELGSLPKIVLTDFSTTNVVTDSATTPRARLSGSTIVKQQSLDVGLPTISDYNCEARPP